MVDSAGLADGFLWLGNHPATDLCNTLPLVDGRRVELLGDFDAVVRWARAAGVTDIDHDDVTTGRATVTAFVRRLREALRAVLEGGASSASSRAAIGRLNEVLASERAVLHVDPSGPDRVRLRAPSAGRQLRLDVAAATLDVFRHDPDRIRRCASAACVLLFLDQSKSGRRRWCDMATCGNRAKAAAHLARTRRH